MPAAPSAITVTEGRARATAANVIDRAVVALRRAGPKVIARCVAGGGLVGWVALLAYYLEQVEGVRTLRPLFGALFVLAFWGRAFLLAGASRALVDPLLPLGTELAAMRFSDVARTASVVGLGLWLWLWLPLFGSYVSPFSAAALLLPLALRGAVAPTWIARAGCERGGGLSVFRRAVGDLDQDRFVGAGAELLLLLGGMAIYLNLLATVGFASLLGRSFLGFDVASLETFFSTRNTFVLVVMAITSAVLLEPLRAAVSAVLYVEARARREGFDLEAAIAGLARLGKRAASVLVCASALGVTAPARADGLTPRDAEVEAKVAEILARSEFRELSGVSRGKTLRELLERLFESLFGDGDWDLPPPQRPTWHLPMPPAWVFVAAALTLLTVVLFVVFRDVKVGPRAPAEVEDDAAASDPRDRSPESHLDEAARLAAEGAYREAFRALYLATLVALDRRGAIAFDRSRTNWHYLRSMPAGATRESFHRFTALFDRKWYGDEATGDDDYRLGRALADRICGADAGETA